MCGRLGIHCTFTTTMQHVHYMHIGYCAVSVKLYTLSTNQSKKPQTMSTPLNKNYSNMIHILDN